MSAWMAFIGQSYYTIPQFRAEATKYGITRRIALLPLQAMSWQDMVLCVQQEPGVEAFSAIVEFPITRLVGLTPEAQLALSELTTVVQIDEEAQDEVVERECGSYEPGSSFRVDLPLSEIAKHLKKLKDDGMDIGSVMIGCSADEVGFIDSPFPRIQDLKHFRGFRSMNRDKFWNQVGEEDTKIREGVYKKRKNPLVSGTFYTKHEISEVSPGIVQEVQNYHKREVISKVTQARVEKLEKEKVEVIRLEELLKKQKEVVKDREEQIKKTKCDIVDVKECLQIDLEDYETKLEVLHYQLRKNLKDNEDKNEALYTRLLARNIALDVSKLRQDNLDRKVKESKTKVKRLTPTGKSDTKQPELI